MHANTKITLKFHKVLSYIIGLADVKQLMTNSANEYLSFDIPDEETIIEADLMRHLEIINIYCSFTTQNEAMSSIKLTKYDLLKMMNDKLILINIKTDMKQDLSIESLGMLVSPFKPVETGCKKKLSELIPHDSSIYYRAINKRISLNKINPYRFLEPISPAAAIKRSRRKIYISNYIKKLKDLPNDDIIVIEGAGGLCSPLALDGYNIDLAQKIHAPTILVARDEIGVINNVILSINILKKYKIKIR